MVGQVDYNNIFCIIIRYSYVSLYNHCILYIIYYIFVPITFSRTKVPIIKCKSNKLPSLLR